MFSSKKNIEELERLVLQVKDYLNLQRRFIRLDAVSKLTVVLSALILLVLLFLIAMLIVLFAAMAGGALLGQMLGSEAAGYGVVTLLFVVLAVIIYAFRRRLITRPLTRFFASLLTGGDN